MGVITAIRQLLHKSTITNKDVKQSAGNNAVQQQASVINNYGLSTSDVTQICKDMKESAIKEFSFIANETANKKIEKFEQKLILKLEGKYEFLKEPSFQLLIRKAQISAAISENDNDKDLDMLAELILHRTSVNDRKSKYAIEVAVENITKIDEDALVQISLFYLLSLIHYNLINDNENPFESLNKIFSNVLGNCNLNFREDVLDHLSLLSAIKYKETKTFLSFSEKIKNQFRNFFYKGFSIENPIYRNLAFKNFGKFIIKHPLKDNCYIISEVNLDSVLYSLTTTSNGISTTTQPRLLTGAEKTSIKQAKECSNIMDNDPKLMDIFLSKFNGYKSLKEISEWWNSMKICYQLTDVGRILAVAYLHSKFPNWELEI